jgi:hypothetical protein
MVGMGISRILRVAWTVALSGYLAFVAVRQCKQGSYFMAILAATVAMFGLLAAARIAVWGIPGHEWKSRKDS